MLKCPTTDKDAQKREGGAINQEKQPSLIWRPKTRIKLRCRNRRGKPGRNYVALCADLSASDPLDRRGLGAGCGTSRNHLRTTLGRRAHGARASRPKAIPFGGNPSIQHGTVDGDAGSMATRAHESRGKQRSWWALSLSLGLSTVRMGQPLCRQSQRRGEHDWTPRQVEEFVAVRSDFDGTWGFSESAEATGASWIRK